MVDVFANFQSRYKYRILGAADATYERVARSLGDSNDLLSKRLKSARTTMTIQVNQIRASGDPAATISKRVGQTQLNFIRTAGNSLFAVRDKATASSITSSVQLLTNELETAMNEYLSSTDRTATEDAQFQSNLTYTIDRLNRIAVQQKGRLAAEGVVFNRPLYQSIEKLARLRDTAAALPPAAAPAAAATPADGGLDITV